MLAAKTNPWTSLFENEQDELHHNQWLADKVARNLADMRANIPHDSVMARLDAILEKAAQGQE